MKPETRDHPFTKPGWLFELKYDGFRMLAERRAGRVCLLYRSGRDATAIFPEIEEAMAALPCDLILDGEAVVLDAAGHPAFQLLQRRAQRTRRIDVEQAAVAAPAVFFAFDLLAFEGYDLRPLPLSARKDLLRRVLSLADPTGPLRTLEALPERGEDLYAAVQGLGLEGIVAKRADSPYRGGYSPQWLKVRVDRTADFAILGFEPAPGASSGFRTLHLGSRQGDGWIWAGTVGTGFDVEETRTIRARLEPARRPRPAVPGLQGGRGVVWVEPQQVCEVRYKNYTLGGNLRQPVFLRLRDDKKAEECVPPLGEDPEAAPDPEPEPESKPADPAGPALTNPDKVFWPEEGYTKGDLAAYYRAIAPWMLPYLRDRPLVLDRYPDGITGKSFFQKNAPGQSAKVDYFLCATAGELLRLVNLGAIPFHIQASRVPDLDRPDWSIVDLDPKGAPFAWVVRIAREVRAICEEIGLPSFVKTSGGSGLHILLPLGGQCDHDQSRQLAEVLARLVTDRLPDLATTARAIPARKGRVYVDALQNGRGKLLAAPFTARPRPGATVSMPLDWSEVGPRLDPGRFTIRTAPARMKRRGDLLLPVLELRPDLLSVLSRLAALL